MRTHVSAMSIASSVAALITLHAGCGGGVVTSGIFGDDGGGADAGSTDAGGDVVIIGTCGDRAVPCFAQSDGGCVGTAQYATCVNGELSCPAGTIPQDQCPPGDDYLACMDAQGNISGTMKTCQSDNDCVLEMEETDCCGTRLYVGISSTNQGSFASCEKSWEAHFPGCGCASNKSTTEDGKTVVTGADGGGPLVHCTNLTSSGGVCMTYSP